MRNLYPDSLTILNDLNNVILQQNINSSTFLKIFSIKKIGDEFLKIAPPDSVARVKIMIQMSKSYYQNGEFLYSKEMCDSVWQYLTTSPNLGKDLNMDDYLYYLASSAIPNNDTEKILHGYFGLLNNNINYEALPILRRSVSWYLKHESKSNL